MKGCNFNNLGFLSPYHFVDDAGFKTFDKFDELVSARQSEEIDPVSILEYLNRRYFLADRTLLRNVRKSAWMTSVNDELPRRLAALPDHGGLETGPELIAAGLTARLRQELLDACSGTRRILLPLSGGMDSRVIAAVLWDLKRTGELSADIDTITWGVDTSRDVIYGQQLATLLKWNWQHLRLTPDVLANNLDVVVGLGCEFAGLHLHAKTALRNLRGYDLVLVASFGDSVGRAMYSGLHVSRLDSLLKVGNPFSLLRQGVYSRILAAAMDDARYYHSLFPRTEAWQANEIDQQAHYMYRMLNPAWAYVNERIPVYQCFGAPSVFGYMWSFSPVSRNDIPYYHLIHTINKELGS